MIVKTEAIVLSTMKFRDTSKIARLYTLEFGKVSVLAKGARSPKSTFRSALEPAQHVFVVMYRKENRDLQLLSQCDVLNSFRHISEDMDKMQAALSAIELVNLVTHGEERNEELFNLLLSVLRIVNDATKTPFAALYYFELKLSGLLGFQPELEACSRCGSKIGVTEGSDREYGFGQGGVLCERCGTGAPVSLSSGSLQALRALQRFPSVAAAMNLRMRPAMQDEIGSLMRIHLKTHIEGFRGLRSEEVFAAMT